MTQTTNEIPEKLKPYQFHGMDLVKASGREYLGECPWCSVDGKFKVNSESGLWGCMRCRGGNEKGGGNVYVFLQILWDRSFEKTLPSQYAELARERGFQDPSTLVEWELARSTLTDDWLLPSYNAEGKRNGMYRWVRSWNKSKNEHRMAWYPTTGTGHGLVGRHLYSSDKNVIYLCEGFWDGAILWETLKFSRKEEELVPTANPKLSLLSDINVLVMPAAKVFFDTWIPLFEGKKVYLCAQNDWERTDEKDRVIPSASYEGMKRVAEKILHVAGEIHLRTWGDGGYNKSLPSGYDVRDWILKE